MSQFQCYFFSLSEILVPGKAGTLHTALCRWTADWKNVTADLEASTGRHVFMYVLYSLDFILISYSVSVSNSSLCHSVTGSRWFFYAFRTSGYTHFSECPSPQEQKKGLEKYFSHAASLSHRYGYVAFKQAFAEISVCLYLSVYLSIE